MSVTESERDSPLDGPPFTGAEDRAFFGHPRGLMYLIAAEGFWAFAYFGMQGILTLYMTQQLFLPGHREGVLGFDAYRGVLQAVFGPLTTVGLASQTYGLITGLIYALPLLGGLISDRWLGQKRTITIGLCILVIGHGLLISPASFLLALPLLIVGSGLVKSNLIGQIGRLYAISDPRRTRGFGWYLIAANVAAFSTPLICGTLGERLGWAYGFAAASVGSVLAVVVYALGMRHMPTDTLRRGRDGHTHAVPLQRGDGRIILCLVLALVPEVLFFGCYQQAFNIFPVWASGQVDRHLLGFEFPVTWFSTLDGLLTILGTFLAVRVWAWQDARRKRASGGEDLGRMGVGCVLGVAAFLLLALAASGASKPSPLLPIGFFLLADFGIPWVDTVSMALVSRVAPAAVNTTMLGVYYLAFAMGNFMVGWVGAFYERLSPSSFWLLNAALTGAALAYLIVAGPWLRRGFRPSASAAAAPAPA